MKRKKDKKVVATDQAQEASGPFNNAFAALSGLRADLGEPAAAPEAAPPPPSRPVKVAARFGPKVVLQREKKGHGGKTITRVRGLPMDAEALQGLAKELKQALGCGARVEGDEILIQGAQGDRAAQWFRAAGAKKIVVSG